MAKKVFLNVFYNIALLTMGYCLIWGFKVERYSIVIAAVFSISLVLFLKLRLIKQIKADTKKEKSVK